MGTGAIGWMRLLVPGRSRECHNPIHPSLVQFESGSPAVPRLYVHYVTPVIISLHTCHLLTTPTTTIPALMTGSNSQIPSFPNHPGRSRLDCGGQHHEQDP